MFAKGVPRASKGVQVLKAIPRGSRFQGNPKGSRIQRDSKGSRFQRGFLEGPGSKEESKRVQVPKGIPRGSRFQRGIQEGPGAKGDS